MNNKERSSRLVELRRIVKEANEEIHVLSQEIVENCSHPLEWITAEVISREDDYGSYMKATEASVICHLCGISKNVPIQNQPRALALAIYREGLVCRASKK